jgi:hypothetical protein
MSSWLRKKLQSMPVSLSATRSLGAALIAPVFGR